MYLQKDGITVEVLSKIDEAKLKSLGYKEVVIEKTPEEQNAEAVATVNSSKGTPKATKKDEEK